MNNLPKVFSHICTYIHIADEREKNSIIKNKYNKIQQNTPEVDCTSIYICMCTYASVQCVRYETDEGCGAYAFIDKENSNNRNQNKAKCVQAALATQR